MTEIHVAGQGTTHSDISIDYPRAERLVKGNPKRQTQSLYTHPNMECGIWECEVGAWRIHFADNKQEFFNVIEGKVRIHNATQTDFIEVKAGEAGIIPAGFVGMFEVVEAVKKYYVLVEA